MSGRTLAGLRTSTRRLLSSPDAAVCALVAGSLAAAAFIANGGLQLGPSTLVEAIAILLGAALAAAAAMAIGLEARLHGGIAVSGIAVLFGVTALSIGWSLHPSDSWVETNRTLAYLATFGAGIAAVRLARRRWPAVLGGILLALTAVSLYGLATKVAPGWLAEDEVYGRLREPYGYWNAVGVTAAMGIPLCLWLGTRDGAPRALNALALPLLGVLIVTMLLSFSRGSILAAVAGLAVWFILVPLRLASLAVLLPSAIAAGAVTAWAFSQGALTDDRVALAAREDAGLELGIVLALMVLLLFAAGIALGRLAERRPLSGDERRRLGTAAIAVVAATPLIALGALAFTDRGIGGTISDRWNDLTEAEAVTPANQPGRLTETASVRSIYWRRALDVFEERPGVGAGAGSFAQAQLKYRTEPARGKHAHGYVHQTLADLGLLGLGVSLLALAAWLLAAGETLALRRGRVFAAPWRPERVGLAALAAVVVVFGVHSAIDWTWFVPAVAMTGLFAAGWVAGRGPLVADRGEPSVPSLSQVEPSLARRRLRNPRRAAGALAVVLVGLLAVAAVAQPWRAQEKGHDALDLMTAGNIAGARAAALDAEDLNPLSVEPYFELAVVEDAAGRTRAAVTALQRAVQLEPASPEAWRRLGDYYLRGLGEPRRAIPVLEGALFLDPLSDPIRADLLAALRAERLLRETSASPRRGGARRERPAPERGAAR